MDSAFARRLDQMIDVPLPDARQRLQLWTVYLDQGHSLTPQHIQRLARLAEIAGGHIRAICETALIIATQKRPRCGFCGCRACCATGGIGGMGRTGTQSGRGGMNAMTTFADFNDPDLGTVMIVAPDVGLDQLTQALDGIGFVAQGTRDGIHSVAFSYRGQRPHIVYSHNPVVDFAGFSKLERFLRCCAALCKGPWPLCRA